MKGLLPSTSILSLWKVYSIGRGTCEKLSNWMPLMVTWKVVLSFTCVNSGKEGLTLGVEMAC